MVVVAVLGASRPQLAQTALAELEARAMNGPPMEVALAVAAGAVQIMVLQMQLRAELADFMVVAAVAEVPALEAQMVQAQLAPIASS